jgi:exocyst complex component 6
MMNENAISNVLIDVDFLEDAFKRIGRPHLTSVFVELRLVGVAELSGNRKAVLIETAQTTTIALSDTVQEFLVPGVRKSSYAIVKPKKLQSLLEKLSKYGTSRRDAPSRELGEKRRKEADAVGRLYPGEGR